MCSAKSFQLFAKVATCPARGSISKIAMLLCVITVRQVSSIVILLMDPRGIWLMKPNVFCKVFSTFRKSSNVYPRGSISKIAMLLCEITVRQHSSIAILLMDPHGIWLMKSVVPAWAHRGNRWGVGDRIIQRRGIGGVSSESE